MGDGSAGIPSILSASPYGTSYSNSSREKSRVCPLMVKMPRSLPVRTRTVYGCVYKWPCWNHTPPASPRHASLLTRNFRSISMFMSSSHTAWCRMLPLYRVSAPAYRCDVFYRKRLLYVGRFPGSGYMGNTPPLLPLGNAFLQPLAQRGETVYRYRFRCC